MSADTALYSRLHMRFQEVFGPPHHDLCDTEQWSLVPSSGKGAINVLLNGTRMGPLVWVFNSQDTENVAKHFAVTHERQIDELIRELKGHIAAPSEPHVPSLARRPFLDDVLTTEQLASRPTRPPSYVAENDALVALAQAMASDPQNILQRTVDTAMRLCRGESAGISILQAKADGSVDSEVFRWRATAGAYAPYVGGEMPRVSPCGAVIDRNALLMFNRPELHYQFTAPVEPPIEEVILAPFHDHGKPAGTVWVMVHAKDRKFDREDARLLASVAQFAGAAYQVISALDSAQTDRTQMTVAHDAAVTHSDELEEIVALRTQELIEANQKLRLSERMAAMGTLSAGLGHDMGNMVAAMRMRLDMLQKTTDARTEHLQAVGDCVTYLHNLASGLRLMTLDPEDKTLGPEPVSLAAWWRAANRVLASGVTHGIVVVSHVSEELPKVLINRVGLTQAAYNLVQNAADAMVGRRGCITIAAELDETRANVLLSFADDGHGMTEEVRRRCMDPLFSTKSSSTSTGLGLALVHTVVKAANASISVESQPGQGTKFTLTLPVAK